MTPPDKSRARGVDSPGSQIHRLAGARIGSQDTEPVQYPCPYACSMVSGACPWRCALGTPQGRTLLGDVMGGAS